MHLALAVRSPVRLARGTGLYSLSFNVLNTGLTSNPTEFSMFMVAELGLRPRFWFMFQVLAGARVIRPQTQISWPQGALLS